MELKQRPTDNTPRLQPSRREFLQQTLKAGLALSCLRMGAHASSSWASSSPAALTDLFYWSATRLAKAIRDKVVSSEEVVRTCLDRISRTNGKVNAVVHVVAERALAEAQAADAALAQGQIRGLLHGVPFTIKDSFDTQGVISTAGTKGRASFVPTQDATVVARLRAAGGILLGKTNTPEFTMAGVTENLVYGRTNNPFDLARTVGGSSGGSAACLAVGGSPLDVGTDTLASVRWPAHCCGIVSIKPTSGRASLAGHIVDSAGALGAQTQPGPMARFVEDLLLVLPLLSGPDPRDPVVQDQSFGNPAEVNLKSLRVAFHTTNGVTTPATEISQTVRAVATLLSGEVSKMEEKRPSELRDAPAIIGSMFDVTGPHYFRDLLQAAGTPLNQATPFVRDLTNLPVLNPAQKTAALARRDAFKEALVRFMQDYDIMLCPVSARLPAPHSDAEASVEPSYTYPYNLAGFPAAVVRGGTTTLGLPIGVQIIGRLWEEHVVLAVAQFLEMALGGFQPVPPPVLGLRRAPTFSTLSWKGYGTLQSTSDIAGPWTEMLEAASPYRITNSTPIHFYRIRQ